MDYKNEILLLKPIQSQPNAWKAPEWYSKDHLPYYLQ